MSRPLVIAGHASGVGKTTVAAGIMGAFRLMDLKVAPFKVGPDYIDPGFHQLATGVPSRNLDTWLTSAGVVRSLYARGSAAADVSVVEGVMGLFDGRAGAGAEGSTAEIAELIGGSILLVVDCSRLGRSLAPLLYGFDRFNGRTRLAGAILNKVGSPRHLRVLKEAAREVKVPVLGEIPRTKDISLKSRHLGLVPVQENESGIEKLEETIDLVRRHVDVEALLAAAEVDLSVRGANSDEESAFKSKPAPEPKVRIAVACDEAFSFYYPDSLESLEETGAQLVYFSPIRDENLPGCDGLYLGGGFPEMFAAELEANAAMRRSVADAVRGGMPAYAECGGMVYLCRGVEVDGKRRQMAGVIDTEAMMTGRRQALGYVEARSRRSSVILGAGERIRGHQFHWSKVKWQQEYLAYDCFSGARPEVEQDGYNLGNLLATYVHIHFAGNHSAAKRFVDSCARAKGVAAGATI